VFCADLRTSNNFFPCTTLTDWIFVFKEKTFPMTRKKNAAISEMAAQLPSEIPSEFPLILEIAILMP
jgi:hypothetical protein